MLMLKRKTTEQILIGKSIVVTITRIGHSSVKIGIEAPRDVPIRRAEVPERQEEKRAA